MNERTTVARVMQGGAVTCDPGDTAERAALLLARCNVGMLPVVDGEGRLRGVVTDRDIVVRCVAAGEDPRQTPVREVMTRSVTTVSPSEDAAEAAKKMRSVQVRRLPVSDGKRVLGVVSLGDIARRERLRAEAAAAFAEVSSNKHKL